MAPASSAVEVVRATLGKEVAWTGEAVPMVITLYSPGPFSGTAAFDLPELPSTAFVKADIPLVGSEEIDGQSYFTQRHEFTLYTQRTGSIVIPAFRVRFSGKKTFTSDPEPIEGSTVELEFQSKRPPGTENLGVVIAAVEMEVTQTWSPDSVDTVNAGDVIERTIKRNAQGTTAMMLPPVAADAPNGVRVYMVDPIVQDHTERGASRAERSETIKYQFERAGTFSLPAITITWWDPSSEELKQEKLAGETISVRGTAAALANSAQPKSRWPLVGLVVAIGLAGWFGWKTVSRILASWHARWNTPEKVSARRVHSACRSGDARAAYAALIDWKRTVSEDDHGAQLDAFLNTGCADDLRREWAGLSRQVFSAASSPSSWSGERLSVAFNRARRGLDRADRTHHSAPALPALNPID